ncbi:MAG: hypothetical protein HY282_04440 [Nitrospirae bacterium]|nr:hypothetical protein [Candidatus Manganitrophaceae bacterium]
MRSRGAARTASIAVLRLKAKV